MWCRLDGNNSRTLTKAVQALSKIGNDLFIEADEKGLLLRTANSIESAAARIRFNRSCFLKFVIQPGEANFCMVSMKVWLNVFRNMRHVEECEFEILKEESKLSIKLKCRSEMTKSAVLSMIDDQNIYAEELLEDATNVITGNCKVFQEMFRTFTNNGDEVTLIPKEDVIIAQNYVENARVNHNFMRSKLQLSPSEFEKYTIGEDASITFALREIRAFVLFAEALKEKMTLRFGKPGDPCFVEVKKSTYIESMLILSTLCSDDVSFSHDYAEQSFSIPTTHLAKSHVNKSSRKSRNDNRSSSKVKRPIVDDTTLSNTSNTSLFQFNDGEMPTTSKKTRFSNGNSVQLPRLVAEDSNEDETPSTSSGFSNVKSVQLPRLLTEESKEMHVDIVSTPQTESGPQVTFYNTPVAENDDNLIAESPERANFVRTIFSRCFQSTYIPREPSPNCQIFAPNSDPED